MSFGAPIMWHEFSNHFDDLSAWKKVVSWILSLKKKNKQTINSKLNY